LKDAVVADARSICGAAVVQVQNTAAVAMSDLNVNDFFSLDGKVALVTGGKSTLASMLLSRKTAY